MKSGKTNLAYANLMLEWAKDLFPICRSITGAGIKKTISYKFDNRIKRGQHKIDFRVKDKMGNENSKTVYFVIIRD